MDLDGLNQNYCCLSALAAAGGIDFSGANVHDLESEYTFWNANSNQFSDMGCGNLVNDSVSRN